MNPVFEEAPGTVDTLRPPSGLEFAAGLQSLVCSDANIRGQFPHPFAIDFDTLFAVPDMVVQDTTHLQFVRLGRICVKDDSAITQVLGSKRFPLHLADRPRARCSPGRRLGSQPCQNQGMWSTCWTMPDHCSQMIGCAGLWAKSVFVKVASSAATSVQVLPLPKTMDFSFSSTQRLRRLLSLFSMSSMECDGWQGARCHWATGRAKQTVFAEEWLQYLFHQRRCRWWGLMYARQPLQLHRCRGIPIQTWAEALRRCLSHNEGMFCLSNHVEADLHEVGESIEHQWLEVSLRASVSMLFGPSVVVEQHPWHVHKAPSSTHCSLPWPPNNKCQKNASNGKTLPTTAVSLWSTWEEAHKKGFFGVDSGMG